LEKARGAYIGFVDGDDWILPHFIEAHLANVRLTGCAVSVCSYHICRLDGSQADPAVAAGSLPEFPAVGKTERESSPQVGVSHAEEMDSGTLFARILTDLKGFVCTKIFSGDLIADVRFDETVHLAEDLLFCGTVLLKDAKCAYFADRLYCYRMTHGSADRQNAKRVSHQDAYDALPYQDAYNALRVLYAQDAVMRERVENAWTTTLNDLLVGFLTGNRDTHAAKRVTRALKKRSAVFLRSAYADRRSKARYVITVYFPYLYLAYRTIRPLPKI
jgi:hypothetical protein